MKDLTLEGIRQFIKRFPDNLIAMRWDNMLQEGIWERRDDLDAFVCEADCLFYGSFLEIRDIGEYWAFREGFLEKVK